MPTRLDRVLLPEPVQQIADADEQEYAVDREVLVKGRGEVVPLYEWEADGALVAQVEWGEEQDAEEPHPPTPVPASTRVRPDTRPIVKISAARTTTPTEKSR